MHLCNWSQKNFQRERLGESEWERKEPAAVNLQQQQPYHLRGKMTLKSTSVHWRAGNPSCNHCYNVGLATASRKLRIAFNLWGFFVFLLSALFSFYVEEWKKKEKQEINLYVSSKNCIRQQFGLEPREFCFWDFPSVSVGAHVAQGQLWPWQGQQAHCPTISYNKKLPVTA